MATEPRKASKLAEADDWEPGHDDRVWPFFQIDHCVKRHQLDERRDEKGKLVGASSVILQAVYTSILSRVSGRRRPWAFSLVDIAEENSLDRNVVSRALAELVERELVAVEMRVGKAPLFHTLNPGICEDCALAFGKKRHPRPSTVGGDSESNTLHRRSQDPPPTVAPPSTVGRTTLHRRSHPSPGKNRKNGNNSEEHIPPPDGDGVQNEQENSTEATFPTDAAPTSSPSRKKSAREPKPPPSPGAPPRAARPRDEVHDAVCEEVGAGGPVTTKTKKLIGVQLADLRTAYQPTPAEVVLFARWFKVKYPGIELTAGCYSGKHWPAFRTALERRYPEVYRGEVVSAEDARKLISGRTVVPGLPPMNLPGPLDPAAVPYTEESAAEARARLRESGPVPNGPFQSRERRSES